MASKRRNMFHKNKTQETTEKVWDRLNWYVCWQPDVYDPLIFPPVILCFDHIPHCHLPPQLLSLFYSITTCQFICLFCSLVSLAGVVSHGQSCWLVINVGLWAVFIEDVLQSLLCSEVFCRLLSAVRWAESAMPLRSLSSGLLSAVIAQGIYLLPVLSHYLYPKGHFTSSPMGL
ncbi:hypothetical protein AAG570_007976 [Ranatra chinensis]|uniref:Uncharacterized protein n=1 Tax=Ranatra chinensis TaxID=642074 RepID=A0ABD0XVD4_9HEMI